MVPAAYAFRAAPRTGFVFSASPSCRLPAGGLGDRDDQIDVFVRAFHLSGMKRARTLLSLVGILFVVPRVAAGRGTTGVSVVGDGCICPSPSEVADQIGRQSRSLLVVGDARPGYSVVRVTDHDSSFIVEVNGVERELFDRHRDCAERASAAAVVAVVMLEPPDVAAAPALPSVDSSAARPGIVLPRVVFVLFEIEGISGEEIAELLEVPLPTVWSRLHFARRTLMKMAACLGRAAIPKRQSSRDLMVDGESGLLTPASTRARGTTARRFADALAEREPSRESTPPSRVPRAATEDAARDDDSSLRGVRIVSSALAAMRKSHEPKAASEMLERYLNEEPHGPFAEEALGLAIEAAVDADQPERAVSRARRYLATYATGRFVLVAQRALRRYSTAPDHAPRLSE